MSIAIQAFIDKEIRLENEDRKKSEIKSWHISKIGSCKRGMYLERMGAKPDKDFDARQLRVFAVGRYFEDWFIEKLRFRKELIVTDQIRAEDKKLGVSGYADVKVQEKEEVRLYEVKTKHSRSFWYMLKEGRAMRQHEYQLWTYLWILGIEIGEIVYLSKDDLAVQQYIVRRDDKKLQKEVFDELSILNWALAEKRPPPMAEEGWQAKYCGYHKQCKALSDEANKLQ